MPCLCFGKSGRRTNRLRSLGRALARCHPVRTGSRRYQPLSSAPPHPASRAPAHRQAERSRRPRRRRRRSMQPHDRYHSVSCQRAERSPDWFKQGNFGRAWSGDRDLNPGLTRGHSTKTVRDRVRAFHESEHASRLKAMRVHCVSLPQQSLGDGAQTLGVELQVGVEVKLVGGGPHVGGAPARPQTSASRLMPLGCARCAA